MAIQRNPFRPTTEDRAPEDRGPEGTPRPGPPPRERAFNVPPVTLSFLAAIGIVYAVLNFGGPAVQHWIVINASVIPIRFAAYIGQPWTPGFWQTMATLVTHAFIHLEGIHILANAGFMLAFGSMAERMIGARRFVVLIVLTATGGAVAQLAATWGDFSLMFGASGVVSGCIGTVLAMTIITSAKGSPRRRLAFNMALILIAANLAIGLGGRWLAGTEGMIAWQAHIGGFLVGFFMPFMSTRR